MIHPKSDRPTCRTRSSHLVNSCGLIQWFHQNIEIRMWTTYACVLCTTIAPDTGKGQVNGSPGVYLVQAAGFQRTWQDLVNLFAPMTHNQCIILCHMDGVWLEMSRWNAQGLMDVYAILEHNGKMDSSYSDNLAAQAALCISLRFDYLEGEVARILLQDKLFYFPSCGPYFGGAKDRAPPSSNLLRLFKVFGDVACWE